LGWLRICRGLRVKAFSVVWWCRVVANSGLREPTSSRKRAWRWRPLRWLGRDGGFGEKIEDKAVGHKTSKLSNGIVEIS
jgi:hypothetical protein